MTRPLGDEQKAVLLALNHYKAWHPGCPWVYTNRSTTVRILDSLVKRGLAKTRPFGKVGHLWYEINDKEALSEWIEENQP